MRYERIACLLIFLFGYLSMSSPGTAQESTAPPHQALASSVPAATSPAAPRSLHELTKDARTALRAEATLEDEAAWELAVRALVALNDELRVHPKNREGSSFAKLKRAVRRRLLATQEELTKSEPLATRIVPVDPTAKTVNGADVLAQQFGGAAAGRGGGIAGGGVGGGQVGGGLGVGAAGGQQADYGDQLVDLIERTISADVWDAVGGPAVIMYHQPNQALIITAPVDVHDDVSDLLRQLRAAGGP